jgi:hypothetical protein
MENPKKPQETEKEKRKAIEKWEIIGLAWDLGYIIALPLVVLALAGKWVDKHYHHETPWVTLIGIVLALVTTTIWLVNRLKKYIK